MVNAAFKRDFAVVRKRQVGFHRGKDALQILGSQARRRAAPEIKGVNKPRRLRLFVAPKLQFLDEAIGKFVTRFRLEGVLVEHTVKAARFAERHVDVRKTFSQTRFVPEAFEFLFGGFSHQRHARRARMNDGFGGKSGMQRIRGIGKVSRYVAGVKRGVHRTGAGFKRRGVRVTGRNGSGHKSVVKIDRGRREGIYSQRPSHKKFYLNENLNENHYQC